MKSPITTDMPMTTKVNRIVSALVGQTTLESSVRTSFKKTTGDVAITRIVPEGGSSVKPNTIHFPCDQKEGVKVWAKIHRKVYRLEGKLFPFARRLIHE